MKEINNKVITSLDEVIHGFKMCSNSLKKSIQDNIKHVDHTEIEPVQKKITTYKTEKYMIIFGSVAAAIALLYLYIIIYYSLSLPLPKIEPNFEGLEPSELVYET